MDDSYTITVTFTRSLAEDQDMAQTKYPDEPLEEALKLQLRDELQEACDDGMAGEFNITGINLNPIKETKW
jgi:hypothetical protein